MTFISFSIYGMAASLRARHRMKQTGKTLNGKHWLWTEEEDTHVRKLYPDYPSLKKILRRRTFRAIQQRASFLNLTKKYHIWKSTHIALLRKLYPKGTRVEIMEKFPQLTWEHIASSARRYKSRRARKPYKRTGFPVIDDILDFAFKHNLTLADIDAYAGTKNYFRKQQWVAHGFTGHKAVLRAIIALGGEIRISWNG